MIGRDEAIAICDERFPDGLEFLIERLAVRVERSDIGDIDGWCYNLPDGSRVVRLSSAATKERQRFTLAHELAHFIIGAQRSMMTLFWDVYDPRSPEERKADALASFLLLPTARVRDIIGGYAIDYSTIKRLMNKARVSDIVVALRLAKSGRGLGLDRPTVIWFENEQVARWLPSGRSINRAAVASLFREATAAPEHTASRTARDGTIVMGSRLPNVNYPALFYYHAAPEAARRSPRAEELRILETILFGDDDSFRRSLNGCIGGNKKMLLELEVIDRVEALIERFAGSYSQKPSQHISKIMSQECFEYLYLRMEDL